MEFSLEKLSENNIADASSLCDECVGENLYTKAYLSSILNKRDYYFYLLRSSDGRYAGYIHFFKTDLHGASKISKLSYEKLLNTFGDKGANVWNLQSIAVNKAFRGYGLSNKLMTIFIEQASKNQFNNLAFGVFWKPKGRLPMGKTLEKFGFNYLCDAHNVWYDRKNLICPYCKGRCVCDAEVYYKFLNREAEE